MSMRPCDRAKALFDAAEYLGLDGPTEEMVSEAINTAQSEAILHTAGPKAHERWYDLELAGIDAITLEPRERQPSVANEKRMDLINHLRRQRKFSLETFGPGHRTESICDHILQELDEIKCDPYDLEEWVDVILLALDGAWRSGYEPEHVCRAIEIKMMINEQREWPDYRTAKPGKAIKHVKNALGKA